MSIYQADHTSDKQRMPAERKEVVVHADPFELQNLAPDRGQLFFQWVAGNDITRFQVRT